MIQPMLIEPGSRILIEQIATRTKNDLPVVIEVTASRRAGTAKPRHIDAINYFEGVIERLDRMIPGGWSRSRTWSELDCHAAPGRAPRRLYLYLQARIGLDELRRIDAAGAEVAKSMDVRHGLAMAPGIAMTSSEVAVRGVDAARRELTRLVARESDVRSTLGQYSIRARWTAVRPVAISPDRDPRPSLARLYLTLLRRRSATRRLPPRTRLDPRRPARLSASISALRFAAGQSDTG